MPVNTATIKIIAYPDQTLFIINIVAELPKRITTVNAIPKPIFDLYFFIFRCVFPKIIVVYIKYNANLLPVNLCYYQVLFFKIKIGWLILYH